MMIYGTTLLIWLCTNFYGKTDVYADMRQPVMQRPETAPAAAVITETESESTTVSEITSAAVPKKPRGAIPAFLEDYVIGVTAAEMPVYFNTEALKAQAVAARTYAYREYLADPNVCLNTIGQAYLSREELRTRWGGEYDKNLSKIKGAVEATAGEVIMYGGEPILAAFCSASGGTTEQSENVWGRPLPYLRSVSSEGDRNAPVFTQTVALSFDALAAKLGVEDASDIRVTKRSGAGYVLTAAAGGRTFSGDDIRRALSLRSSDFYIGISDSGAELTVYGYGHGVGMSQYGAEFMAQNGSGYRDILNHYYTDVQIEKLDISHGK